MSSDEQLQLLRQMAVNIIAARESSADAYNLAKAFINLDDLIVYQEDLPDDWKPPRDSYLPCDC